MGARKKGRKEGQREQKMGIKAETLLKKK